MRQAYATGKMPYSYISQVKKGKKAIVELEGYSSNDYNSQQGYIEAVQPEVITIDGQNYFNRTLLGKRLK